jgi:ribosomal protein L37E
VANKKTSTLGDLVRNGSPPVRVTCRGCGHTAVRLSRDIAMAFGFGRRVEGVPFRCRECGSQKVDVRIDPDALLSQKPIIARRPEAGRD